MNAPQYQRYPLVMNHPGFKPAVVSQWVWDPPATPGAAPTTGRHVPEHGTAAQFPPVTVHHADDEEYYRSKGYRAPDDAQQQAAFQQQVNDHIVNPRPKGYAYQEYPRWENGVLVEDPAKPQSAFQEYPKWIGDKLVHCRQEEESLRAWQNAYVVTPPEAPAGPTPEQAAAQLLQKLTPEQLAALVQAVQGAGAAPAVATPAAPPDETEALEIDTEQRSDETEGASGAPAATDKPASRRGSSYRQRTRGESADAPTA